MNIIDKLEWKDLKKAVHNSELTTTELNILRYAASEIKKNPYVFPATSFSAKEFMKKECLDYETTFYNIKKLVQGLSQKHISMHKNGGIYWLPLLRSLIIDHENIHLEFNPNLKKLILEGDF